MQLPTAVNILLDLEFKFLINVTIDDVSMFWEIG